MSKPAGGPIAQETEAVGKESIEETEEVERQPVQETEEVERHPIQETGEVPEKRPKIDPNRETAGAVSRPALDLTVAHGASSGSLRIENPYLAAGAIAGALVCLKLDSTQLVEVARGFGVAAGVAAGVTSVGALTYLWVTNRGPTETAIRNSLEGRPAAGAHARDPEVETFQHGSLLVKIRCHSRGSLVQFIEDYESGNVKRRLNKELSKIGFTGDLKAIIENREELEEHIKTLNVPAKTLTSRQQRSSGSEWSQDQAKRLGLEKGILSKYFRNRVTWMNPRDRRNTMVESRMTTSNDKSYTLRIYIPADYPNSCPTLAVCSPHGSLKKVDGSMMTKETSQDHTYGSRDGLTVICHFRPSWWTGVNTLFQVFMKGLLWLEAYEGHLHTGKPLSAYLREMYYY